MKDKSRSSKKKKALHQGYEGQNWVKREEKVLHQACEEQNWVKQEEKSPSLGLGRTFFLFKFSCELSYEKI